MAKRTKAPASTSASSSSNTASAPSTPRAIPKSGNNNKNNNNKKKKTQPSGSLSSSYNFDEMIDNPFISSTPPTFTPSMERTALVTPPSSAKEAISSPSAEAPIKSALTHTPNTPMPIVEKPFSAVTTRSRNGSMGSIPGLPGPRHEDMILPTVARRIKEQGLHEYNVIAYSDDYNAPLYKIPTSQAAHGHPFASYDRLKAASATSLGGDQSPSSSPTPSRKDASSNNNNALDSTSALPPNPPIPAAHEPPSPRNQEDADQVVPDIKSDRRTQPQQGLGDRAVLETEQYNVPVPSESSPERPRRARRNTDHRTQPEVQTFDEEFAPEQRRTRHPTNPESTPSSRRQQRQQQHD
ncbi:hypothetical protein BGZ99_003591, partial [Dissophora globulifera]